MVIFGNSSFSLEDLDGDSGLLVLISSKGLGLLGWDNSAPVHNFGHDSSDGLNTQTKRGNVDQENVLGVLAGLTSKDSSLYSCSVGYGLIGVDASVRFLTVEEVFDESLNLWDSGGSTNQYNLVDISFFHARVIKNLLDRCESLLE
jgi:hypothetical protein